MSIYERFSPRRKKREITESGEVIGHIPAIIDNKITGERKKGRINVILDDEMEEEERIFDEEHGE